MQALIEALDRRFQESPLAAALDGKLYLAEVPRETRLPYAVYTLVSVTPEYTFSDTHERVSIQVDLFAGTHEEAVALYEGLRDTFDDCRLEVAGYRFGKMERVQAQEVKEPHFWRWITEYIVTLEEV